MFFKIGAIKNFTDFTEKHMCWSLFNKVAGLKTYNIIKKRLQHRCFAVKFENIEEHFFNYRTPPVPASGFFKDKNSNYLI